jgi:hypothetical protein
MATPLKIETEQSILQLTALGLSAKLIHRQIGVNPHTVSYTLRKHHTTKRQLRITLIEQTSKELAMAQVDFSNLLSQPMDQIKRPPVKPAGTYHATIAEHKFGRSAKKGTPFVEFQFTGVQPGDDIDPEQLKDTDGTPIDLSKWKPNTQFYLTQDSIFRLKEFIEVLQIPTKGRSMNEAIPETRGLPVLLTVSMKASEDGSQFFNRVEHVTAG